MAAIASAAEAAESWRDLVWRAIRTRGRMVSEVGKSLIRYSGSSYLNAACVGELRLMLRFRANRFAGSSERHWRPKPLVDTRNR